MSHGGNGGIARLLSALVLALHPWRSSTGAVDSFGANEPAASGPGCYTNGKACAALTFDATLWGNILAPPQKRCGVDAASSIITVAETATTRTIVSNGCPGYDWRASTAEPASRKAVSGYPAVQQALTFDLPRAPVMANKALDVSRFHGPVGVALNGVPFYGPGDAAGRDQLRRAAGKLDACGGTVMANGQYAYMQTPGDTDPLSHYASRNNRFAYCDSLPPHMRSIPGLHSPLLGFALDGVPIYGPQDVGGVPAADLDECGGHTDAEHPFYHYHLTSDFPYLPGCLRGCLSAANHAHLGTNTQALTVPPEPVYEEFAREVDCAEAPRFRIGPGWEMKAGVAACRARCSVDAQCRWFVYADDFSCRTYTSCLKGRWREMPGLPNDVLYRRIPSYSVACVQALDQYAAPYAALAAQTRLTYVPPTKCIGLSLALNAVECAAWQTIYDQMGGKDWGFCARDIERSDPCFCAGSSQFVQCQADGSTILKMHLPTNRLSGTLPTAIAHFTNLQSLDLAGNRITGSLPATISGMVSLSHVNLGTNLLVGSLPPLAPLTKLTSLSLVANALGDGCLPLSKTCGAIPDLSALTNLGSLSLGANSFAGALPDLSALQKLSSLNLGGNPRLKVLV